MRAAVIAYTVNGAILAEKLRHLSDDETDIYVSAKSAKYIEHLRVRRPLSEIFFINMKESYLLVRPQ